MAKKPNPKQKPVVVPSQLPPRQPPVKEQKTPEIFSIGKLCIVLAVISIALYANTLRNGYVMDDVMVIKENTIVAKGISAIPELFSTPHMRGYLIIPNDMYRPLSLVMFAVEYQFFGTNPMVGHFFNILLFAGCVIMLFLFLHRFFDREKLAVAFMGALLFALHPIHTEVVDNIKSRDELLCFFFAFWSLNLFMSYIRDGKMSRLLSGALMLLLSYLSKETVVTFLAAVPLLFFFYKNENRKRALFITIGTLIVSIVFIAIRYAVLKAYHANEPTPVDFIDNALAKAPSALSRIATEMVILGNYLKLMFVPYPLLSTYSYNAIPFASLASTSFWVSLAIWCFLVFYAVSSLIKKKKDPLAFGILFFIITISLFSNIPFLMGAEMAERFAFFASAGFCLAAAYAIDEWLIKGAANDIMVLKSAKVLAVLIPVCLLFGGMTIARNTDWKDNYTLYKSDLEKSPENSRLYHYIATALAEDMYAAETDTAKRRAMDEESIGYLRKALEIYPDFTEAHVELGRLYDRSRMYDSAIVQDIRALALNPSHATANNNLGSVYLTTGKYPEAVTLFKRSIAFNPGLHIAYINLARTYGQMKQYDSEIVYFNKMLAFEPKYFPAEQELGIAYFSLQKYDSAEVHFRQALAINPNDPNTVNNLGAIYLNSKRYPQAIEQFKRAVALNSGYINAVSNLGRAYFFNKQYEPAIELFNKALAIDPKYVRDIPYIAMSYKSLGKMDMALKYEAIAKRYYPDFRLP